MPVLSTFLNELRLLSHQIFGETGGKLLAESLRKGGVEGAGIMFHGMREAIKKNPRAEVVLTLMSLDVSDLRKLLAIHKVSLKEHRENRFVVALGEMLPRKDDGKVDTEAAQRIYAQLVGELTNEEIGQLIEMLVHDPIAQQFRYWTQGAGKKQLMEFATRGAEWAVWLYGLTLNKLDVATRFDNATTALAAQEAEYNRRSWWRRWYDIRAR